MPNRILILFFHPRFENSRANRAVVNELVNVPGVKFKDMYEIYPDFNIIVDQEQADLLDADIIIFSHPFHWYSCPPLMKQWIDLVLTPGWAYAKGGDKLTGKFMFHFITCAGSFEAYSHTGRNNFTIRELLRPFEQTANLCHMKFMPPYMVTTANRLSVEELKEHAQRMREIVEDMSARDALPEAFYKIEYLNELNS